MFMQINDKYKRNEMLIKISILYNKYFILDIFYYFVCRNYSVDFYIFKIFINA